MTDVVRGKGDDAVSSQLCRGAATHPELASGVLADASVGCVEILTDRALSQDPWAKDYVQGNFLNVPRGGSFILEHTNHVAELVTGGSKYATSKGESASEVSTETPDQCTCRENCFGDIDGDIPIAALCKKTYVPVALRPAQPLPTECSCTPVPLNGARARQVDVLPMLRGDKAKQFLRKAHGKAVSNFGLLTYRTGQCLWGLDEDGHIAVLPIAISLPEDIGRKIQQANAQPRHWMIVSCSHQADLVNVSQGKEIAQTLTDPNSTWGDLSRATKNFITQQISTDPAQVLRLGGLITSTLHQLESFQMEVGLAFTLLNPPPEGELHAAEDVPMPAGGPGAPVYRGGVAEIFAVATVQSDRAASRYLAQSGELITRLPHTWQKVKEQQIPLWRAKRLANLTMELDACTATALDQEISQQFKDMNLTQMKAAALEAELAHNSEKVMERVQSQKDERGIWLDRRTTEAGTCKVYGVLDAPDAEALYGLLTNGAQHLIDNGQAPNKDIGRARAAGMLGRGELIPGIASSSPTGNPDTDPTAAAADSDPTVADRDPTAAANSEPAKIQPGLIKFYVHFSGDQITEQGASGTAQVEGYENPILLDVISRWCSQPDLQIQVTRVIDLAEEIKSTGYQPSDRLREQIIVRDPVCAFPGCQRSARTADLDHIQPFDDGGETTSANLAPLCRKHHRAKTRRQWEYQQDADGYQWSSLTAYIDAKYLRVPKARPKWFRFPKRVIASIYRQGESTNPEMPPEPAEAQSGRRAQTRSGSDTGDGSSACGYHDQDLGPPPF